MKEYNINNNDIDIENNLKLFILNQIKNERELTQNKINLLLKYSQKQIFNFLSNSDTKNSKINENYISSKSIINKFKSFNEKLLNQIIIIYDKDKDLLLNYKEFYYFISPKYIDTNIDELREKNENNLNNEELNEFGINIINNIFNIEIKNINEISNIMANIIIQITSKSYLKNNYSFYLFKLIKGNDKDYDYINEYLIINDILKFLLKNQNEKDNNKIYEQDVANFIFRFDYDNDLKLSFKEFENMINYFLNNINENNLNLKQKINLKEYNRSNNRNPGKLFYDYSSLNIDITNGSQFNTINKMEEPSFDLSKHIEERIQNEQAKLINENRQNSFLNNISLTYNDLDDVLSSLINNKNNCNFNGNNIDINSLVNFKEKEIQNIKIGLLTEYFNVLIKELNEVELNKQKIAKEFNINIPGLFSLFDCHNDKNISSANFIYIFSKFFNQQFKEKDFKYLIKKYDKNKDNKLNYEEFCHMILPSSKEYKKIFENKFNNKKSINEYSNEEKKIILNLFLILIKCEEVIQEQKIKLNNCPFFTYFEMFEFIRNKENKLIKREDIYYFLKSNNIIIIDDKLDILMNYLFLSADKDKSYDFRNFMRILQPF